MIGFSFALPNEKYVTEDRLERINENFSDRLDRHFMDDKNGMTQDEYEKVNKEFNRWYKSVGIKRN